MLRKQPENQLSLDYSVSGNRMVICLGHKQSYVASEYLFSQLICNELRIESANDFFEVSPIDSRIENLGYKFPYPNGMCVAELSDWDDDFIGFSAIVGQQGWAFLSKSLNVFERNYYLNLLTLSLGLNTFYMTKKSLKERCEKLVTERMLPNAALEEYLSTSKRVIDKNELEALFQLPYQVILKTALTRYMITSEEFERFQVKETTTILPSEKEISNQEEICISDGQLFIEGFGF